MMNRRVGVNRQGRHSTLITFLPLFIKITPGSRRCMSRRLSAERGAMQRRMFADAPRYWPYYWRYARAAGAHGIIPNAATTSHTDIAALD